jgi:photosystem II stability/assembly factor-like uncharacterized protein
MRFAPAAVVAATVLALGAAAFARSAVQGVPRGFRPETAAAIGARDLWVLGEYGCSGGRCLALLRSTDSGSHFTRVALPPLPAAQAVDPRLVFADARDGFVYDIGGSPLFATHDGGASWNRTGPDADVTAFAVAGGYAYAVLGRQQFERSPVVRPAWRTLLLPFPTSGGPLDLAAHGSRVWVVGTSPSRKPVVHSKLGRSADRGSSFAVKAGPCEAGLPGWVIPVGKDGLWAVCSTGMMAALSLSTNDGRSFAIRSFHDPGGVRQPTLINSADIAPASARIAVLSRGAGGALLRTTDAGSRWSPVPGTADIDGASLLGFSTSRVGTAIVQRRDGGTELWRTTDAGASWHSVPIR